MPLSCDVRWAAALAVCVALAFFGGMSVGRSGAALWAPTATRWAPPPGVASGDFDAAGALLPPEPAPGHAHPQARQPHTHLNGTAAAAAHAGRLLWLRGTTGSVAPTRGFCEAAPDLHSGGAWTVHCACDARGALAGRPMLRLALPRHLAPVDARCISGCHAAAVTPVRRYDNEVGGALHVWINTRGARCNAAGVAVINVDVAVPDTPEARARAHTCFASLGDWGSPLPEMLKVARALDSVAHSTPSLRFVLSTGDAFYPSGVKSAHDPQFEFTFERPFGTHRLRGLLWYMAVGNHDQEGVRHQIAYGRTHPRYHLPAASYGDTVPVTPTRDVSMAVIDAFGGDTARQEHEARRRFEKHLRRVHPPWRMVVAHGPLHSGGKHGLSAETEGQRRRWGRMLRDNKVQLHVAGHDHLLEVHRADGTDFFVSGGGGGAEQYGSRRLPTTRYWAGGATGGDRGREVGSRVGPGPPGFMLHCLYEHQALTYVVVANGSAVFQRHTPFRFDPADDE